MPTIAVVIVSYNTRELLHQCISSLQTCTFALRLIVIENASHDGSAEMLRAEFPTVELIALDQNIGFAAGVNRGLCRLLESPAHEYILLLNPDTVVHANAIELLVGFLEEHPRVGVASPRLLNSDQTIQSAAFRFPTLAMTVLDLFPPGEVLPGRLYNSWWHGRYPQERNADFPFAIDHPLGACFLVRREVIEQVGDLDEAFFMYAEEIDWCYRIHQAGWAIWQVPQARVTHIGGAATRQFRSRMLIALYESRLLFFRKHYSPSTVHWHTWIIRLGMVRAILQTWCDYARDRLSRDQLRQQVWAYGKVVGL